MSGEWPALSKDETVAAIAAPGGQAEAHTLDVTDAGVWKLVVDRVIASCGRIDGLGRYVIAVCWCPCRAGDPGRDLPHAQAMAIRGQVEAVGDRAGQVVRGSRR